MALRRHRRGDGPQRLSLRPQRDHFADRLLLGLMRDQRAVVAEPEAKRHDPAKVRGFAIIYS
jgi:hypothetical protein